MTGEAGHDRVLPPAFIETRIDLASDRFEAAWKSGTEPQIETFLKGWQGPGRTTLLQELVSLDLEYRWQQAAGRHGGEGKVLPHIVPGSHGESATPHDLPTLPLLEDYVLRFPELGPSDQLPDELFVLEYEIRCRWGERPGYDEYLARFGHRISRLIRRMSETKGRQHIREAPASTKDIKSTRTLPSRAAVRTRCPYCHHLIDLPEDVSAVTFRCRICDHAIDLVGGTSTRPRGVNAHRLAHFELVEQLGTGGFGVVWKARDVRLDRLVALKIPRDNRLGTEEIEKFLREARTAAQLKHPNIVRIHEVGREDDSFYIVSDYIEGLSLDRWLADQPMTPREAAELCRELAGALQYAHAEGIIHRDLKPSNIMVDPQGRPHIMDFGLAKREVGEITMTLDGAILGTPAYMSPEQARGKGHEADRRSDIYSLGVILFELLTGELPFRGERQMLMVQILNDEPPSPRHLNNHVPRDLETICLKCLEKAPDRRYQTAGELADDLDRQLAGEPIQARPAGRAEKLWRWCRRKPAVASLTVAVALLFLIGTGISTYFAMQASLKARESELHAREATSQRDLTRRHLYASQMNLAEKAWEAGNIGRVLQLLETQYPESADVEDLRGWEWHHLWRLCHQQRLVIPHLSLDLAFSPDARLLASAGEDGTIKLWDPQNGEAFHTIRAHADRVVTIAFSPDGSLLASGSRDRTVKFWNVVTGEQVGEPLQHTRRLRCVTFSPDGKSLLSSEEDRVAILWDVATGTQSTTLGSLHDNWSDVFSVAFDPSGRVLATASEYADIGLWDASSGQPIGKLQGHDGAVRSVAFHPNGQILASGSIDGTVRFWEMPHGREIGTLTAHLNAVDSVAFSSDGSMLVSCDRSGTIRIWDVHSQEELRTLKGHTDGITRGRFSPDGRLVASGSWDGTVRLWDADAPLEPLTLVAHRSWVKGVSFSPDGQHLASIGFDTNVKIWDTDSGQPVLSFKHGARLQGVAFHPNGEYVASAGTDKTIKLWNVVDGEAVRTLEGHRGFLFSVAFRPDGKLLASGGSWPDYFVKLWEVDTGREVATLSGHSGVVGGLAFNPDGRLLASGSKDGTVKLWDVSTGDEVGELKSRPLGGVKNVAFSPDGRLLASDAEGFLFLWNIDNGHTLWSVKAHTPSCAGLTFTPDGRRLVSGGLDRTVKLWDVKTGQLVATLKGHRDDVQGVAVSPDGHVIATCGKDLTIKLWDARPLTRERRDEMLAFELVESLFRQQRNKDEVLKALQADTTSWPSVRERAIEMARQRYEEPSVQLAD